MAPYASSLADFTIGLAFGAIPVALSAIARRRTDLVPAPIFWLFSAFFLLCGIGHWLTLWAPAEGVAVAEKAATAIVAIVTSAAMLKLLPRLLAASDALREDILRSKRNEAVLRDARDVADAAARATSDFLATMSHEIRSPMSGLIGVLEMLRATSLNADQARMAGMIQNSAQDLLAVLNDVLDFSKIESGALAINAEAVAIGALVEEVAQPHLLEAAAKGVALHVRRAPDLPGYAMLDPLRLRQILNNLLSNAVKFTAAGDIGLSVDMSGTVQAPRLRFAVRDTGMGMTPEVLSRLFNPFMQADSSTSRDFGGTGLGLSISRRLAALQDGSLMATSRAGEGSAFILSLPYRAAAAPVIAAPAAPIDGASLAGLGPVLVADDDPTNRWLARRKLESLGLEVSIADGGAAALALLESTRFALLLTDYHMPGMDGVALARAIRAAADPVLRALPIVGLTADVTAVQSDLCRDAGMNEVAIKPLTREQMYLLLSRHLPGATPPVQSAPVAALPVPYVAFHDAGYRDLFAAGDPEGEVWLAEFLAVADGLAAELDTLLCVPDEALLHRYALAAAAHRLLGSALSAGAIRLGEAALLLERAAAREDLLALHRLHAALRGELVTARGAITAFIADNLLEQTT